MKNKIETVDVNINQIAHSPIQMSKPVQVRSINFIEFDIPIPYSLKIEPIFFLLNLNIYHEKTELVLQSLIMATSCIRARDCLQNLKCSF